MSDGVHSCSYYCNRPACVLAQRDELRERYVAAPADPTAACVEAMKLALGALRVSIPMGNDPTGKHARAISTLEAQLRGPT